MVVSFLVVRKVDILARGGTGSVSNVLTLSQNKRKKKVWNMHFIASWKLKRKDNYYKVTIQ